MSEQGWLKKTFVHRDYLRLVGGWTDPFLNTPQSLTVHPWKNMKKWQLEDYFSIGIRQLFRGEVFNFRRVICIYRSFVQIETCDWEVLIVLRGIGHVRQCCAHLLVIGACHHHLQRHPWMRRSDTARTEHMVVHVAVSAQQARWPVVPPVVVGWLRQCEDGKTYLHRAWQLGHVDSPNAPAVLLVDMFFATVAPWLND